MSTRTRPVNDIGIGFAGLDNERAADIRVYVQSGTVIVELDVRGMDDQFSDVRHGLQYLTAAEAMAFAKAFERCAIQALKDSVP